ncbi:MAG: HAD family phosphatase [Clostridium sp.]|nr:HAD family phosphatase [Clostridium sp.]
MIKNLLFDLGGVIMDIRRRDCVEAYRRLGMKDPDSMLGEYVQQGPFQKLEAGEISPEEFRRQMRPYLRPGVTDREIDNAFLAFLTGIPVGRLAALRRLREKYRVYLLSNTNPIMWNSRIAEEFRKEGFEREDYFDGMVTSFEARSMKPSPEIFRYAVAKFGIVPSETLFLDDSAANIRAAEALGFKGLLVPPGQEFEQLLTEMDTVSGGEAPQTP